MNKSSTINDENDEQLSPQRRRLLELLEQANLSLSKASIMVNKNNAYLFQFIKKGVPRTLPETVRLQLAEILRVDERLLRDTVREDTPYPHIRNLQSNSEFQSPHSNVLPCFTGRTGQMVALNERSRSWNITAPDELEGVSEAFAVMIEGEGLMPVVRPGSVLYCHPYLPPMPGDIVAAMVENGPVLVGLMVSQSAETLVIGFANDADPIQVPVSLLARVGRVVKIQPR